MIEVRLYIQLLVCLKTKIITTKIIFVESLIEFYIKKLSVGEEFFLLKKKKKKLVTKL